VLHAIIIALTLVGAVAQPTHAQGQNANIDANKDMASSVRLAREGSRITKSDAEQLENLLAGDPENVAARAKLLGFYYRGALPLIGRAAVVENRRRHILWLIEHHPESEMTELAEATLDATGHGLADREGFERAAASWLEQTRLHAADAAVLRHAAKFFQLSDKERAIALLAQARDLEPTNRELPALTGYVYGLAILGVDMINQNGLPTSHNPAEASGDFARRAIDQLTRSSDVATVGTAGLIVRHYGLMLAAMFGDRFRVDHVRLAEGLLTRARDLEPGNPHWQDEINQLHKPK
jgi:hypothetical protein